MAPIFLFSVTRITHFQVDHSQDRHQDEDDEGQRRGVAEVGLALDDPSMKSAITRLIENK